jgi:uracil-DNA glycosylase family 4
MTPSYFSPTCKTCRRFRPCSPSGPVPSSLLFLGEGPGESEDWKRLPFIGPSGRELDRQYLPLSGLMRQDVYVTNAIKCRQGKKGGDEPEPWEVMACALHHLPGELSRVQPSTIVTLGSSALRLFGDYPLELHHGRPLSNQTFGPWTGTVFPIYHPAAGLRKSEYMIELQDDFRALRLFLRGELTIPTDPYPTPHYRALHTPDELTSLLRATSDTLGSLSYQDIAIDTETDKGRTWCLTFSLIPGTGYLIRSDNPDTLAAFRSYLLHHNPLTYYHNYLFDAPRLAELDLRTPRWCDTMQEAYQLCSFPQALKILCYRYLGMVMQEYEDLVLPYAIDSAIEYLFLGSKKVMPEVIEALPWKKKVLRCSGGKGYGGKHGSTEIEFTQPDTVGCPVCGKPKGSGNMERDKGGKRFIWDRCAAILTDTMEKGANPLRRWAAVPEEERAVLEAVMGKMKAPSISEVPFEEAVGYACRDADGTLRLRPVLRRAAAAMGRRIRGRE